MNSKCSLDELANLEFALKEKFGEIAIINPKSLWNLEFEKIFQKQQKELIEYDKKREKNIEKIERDGFLISKNLFKEKHLKCAKCGKNLLDFRDKIYIDKAKTCFLCYIKYVEGRKEFLETRKEG